MHEFIEQTPLIEQVEPQRLDALIVLGRGTGETAYRRARHAAEMALRMPEDSAVIFCGGSSWNESIPGVESTEGEVALSAAVKYLDALNDEQDPMLRAPHYTTPGGVKLLSETTSKSTLDNLCNSVPILQSHAITPSRMGAMSDDLHFLYHRPTDAARLVFPGIEIVDIPIAREYTKQDVIEEWLITKGTNFFMRNVAPGDHEAIIRQQRAFEHANRRLRRVVALPMRLLGK